MRIAPAPRPRLGAVHGFAGNILSIATGFELLPEQTRDEMWLERARAFAMHALTQVDRQHEQHGQGRFGLWMGDLGVALYAWQCIEGDPALPALTNW